MAFSGFGRSGNDWILNRLDVVIAIIHGGYGIGLVSMRINSSVLKRIHLAYKWLE